MLLNYEKLSKLAHVRNLEESTYEEIARMI